MRWPLRRQIMLPVLAVAVTSLGAVGALNAWFAEHQTRDQIERQLRGVVAVLRTSNFPLTNTVLRQMRDLSSAEFVLVDDEEAIAATSLPETPLALPATVGNNPPELVTLGPPVEINGAAYFHTQTRLPTRSGGRNATQLHVLFPVSEYRRTWREAFVPPLVVGVIAVGAVAIVARMIAGRLSRATARLEGDVLRIAKGDFTPAELPTTDDEIRDLSLAVNQTAVMLADYELQVRRTEQMRTVSLLGAGLAHEMRNAATGCRMALDLHAEQCGSRHDGESLSVAKRQLRLMESQLQRFLRAGKPLDESVKQLISFSEVVEDSLSLVRPSARHARVELKWTPPEADAVVHADREALGQVVLNLLINAIEAVQQRDEHERRTVEVSLRSDDVQAEFVVEDSGPGPSELLRQELFAPFVTSKAEGVGLGLAVAREVVAAHHGTIDWFRMGETTKFQVTIPLATPLATRGAAHV